MNERLRLKWIQRTVLLFLFAGILLSYKLWISDRNFPLSPVFDPLTVSPFVDRLLISLFLVLIIVDLFLEKKILTTLILMMLTFLVAMDQMRLQPWIYIYFLFMLPLVLSNDDRFTLNSIRLIIPGIYVWSGVHKMNEYFVQYLKGILVEVINVQRNVPFLESFIQFIPFFELAVGLALLFPTFRQPGVWAAAILHSVVLLLMGPTGANMNSVIWPWNLAMTIMVVLVFHNQDGRVILHSSAPAKRAISFTLAILVWILPSFNYIGWWDNYLSFSLYSGKISNFYIAIKQDQVHKIEKGFHQYFAEIEGLQGGEVIDVQKWCMEELNVPFTGEARIFKNISKSFCLLDIPNDDLMFLGIPPNGGEASVVFTCNDLSSQK
jgi:hypothetical protein